MGPAMKFLVAAAVLAGAALLQLTGAPTVASDIDCDLYPDQRFAQLSLRLIPHDPHDLDGPNDNGIACEELPCPCDLEPVPEAIGDAEPRTSTASLPAAATVSVTFSTPAPDPTATSPPSAAAAPTSTPAASLSAITPPSTGGAGLR